MRRPRPISEPVAQGNTIVPCGPCRPEQFLSQANRFPSPVTSILHANLVARGEEIVQEHAMRHGMPFNWDAKRHEIRHQYRRKIVNAGDSTWGKCCDDIS